MVSRVCRLLTADLSEAYMIVDFFLPALSSLTMATCRSPDECGGPGKPCCPQYEHIYTDKRVPDLCMGGAFCGELPGSESMAMTGWHVIPS